MILWPMENIVSTGLGLRNPGCQVVNEAVEREGQEA